MNIQFSSSPTGTRNTGIPEITGATLREANVFSPNPAIDPENYYIPGQGSPAISTADFYQSGGLYGFRPYDLLAMGSQGAAVAATPGKGRYVWLWSADHPGFSGSYLDGISLMAGYSNDPGVLPQGSKVLFYQGTAAADSTYIYHTPWLVYNPEAVGDQLLIFGEASTASIERHHTSLVTTSNFDTMTHLGIAFDAGPVYQAGANFQHPYRRGANDWWSVGNRPLDNLTAEWTTTSPTSWTASSGSPINEAVGSSHYEYDSSWAPIVSIGGQNYQLFAESPNLVDCHATLVPIDTHGQPLASPAPIRLTEAGPYKNYFEAFPGPEYLQMVSGYAEDGVMHFYMLRGFPHADPTLVAGARYENGGGLWEQFIDRHSYVFDATLAAQAAPSGLTASCTGGVVTLTWDDYPTSTYRLKRYTSAPNAANDTSGTSIGDVTGASTTNTPTTPNTQYWYRLWRMEGATPRGSRIVDVYASNNTAFVNKHILRVLNDGGTFPAGFTHLIAADALLTANGWHSNLMWWPDAAFGIKYQAGASPLIEVVYCLGTTRMPVRGDYRPISNSGAAGTTTYHATGVNSIAPAWVNPNETSFGYFGNGRVNNIRRKIKISVFACYQKSHSNNIVLLSTGEGVYMALSHNSDGIAYFGMWSGASVQQYASKSVSGPTAPHVIGATYDDVNAITYVDGVAGTPLGGFVSNATLEGVSMLKGQVTGATTSLFLGSGSLSSKIESGFHSFGNNQAQFSCAGIAIFDKAFSGAEVTVITDFYHDWIGI